MYARELRMSLDSFFELTSEYCCLIDKGGVMLEANKRLVALLREERGEQLLSYVAPKERDDVEKKLRRVAENDTLEEFSTLLPTSDGSGVKVAWRAKRAGEAVLLLVGQGCDRRESYYKELYSRAPALIHCIDARGTLIEVSDFWLETLGYTAEQVIGRRTIDFLTPESQDLLAHLYPAFLRSGVCHDVPLVFLRSDGTEVRTLVSAVSELDAEGSITRSHVVAVDVTERLRVESALEESHSLVLRKGREFKEIAVAASHDLKAPVRNIQMFTALALQCCDQETKELLKYVEEAGKRLQSIVTELTRYMILEQETPRFRAIDLNELFDDVTRGLHAAVLESGAEIVNSELPTVVGSRRQLYSLFENVLSNALKFRTQEPPVLEFTALEAESHWVFVLQDNGVGVEKEFRQEVFKLFRRLHPVDVYEGTGAGLAVAKKIVEYHGGDIEFLPSERGARLRFTLRKLSL